MECGKGGLRIEVDCKDTVAREGEMLCQMGRCRGLSAPRPWKFTTEITCSGSPRPFGEERIS